MDSELRHSEALDVERSIRLVSPDELTERQLEFLEEVIHIDGLVSVEAVLKMARTNDVQIFAVRTRKGDGVIVTQVLAKHGGLELLIWMIAGDGLVVLGAETKFILGFLESFAKVVGAKTVTAITLPTIAKLLCRYGYESSFVHVSKEVQG